MIESAGPSRFDAIVVGGGLIGCATARELAGRGLRVAVLERAEPGAEASSAAAGMLSPQTDIPEPGPFFDLARESRDLHARWAQDLASETGIDVGYRRCGILRCSFAPGSRLAAARAWQREAGLAVESLDPARALSLTGGRMRPDFSEAVFLPDEAIVNSSLLTRAVALSGERRGVRIFSNTPARRFRLRGSVCVGVETDSGTFESPRVVDAAGAWASFDTALPFAIPVEPVRGQMVELSSDRELETVVHDDDVYLVPRSGGRVLVGSTLERAGFRKQTTAAGIAGLLAAAARLFPDLAQAEVVRTWAGLRPGTPDGLPILGPSPVSGLFLAAGHFRNGILLAPVTAVRLADLMTGTAGLGLEAFTLRRFGALSEKTERNPPASGVFG